MTLKQIRIANWFTWLAYVVCVFMGVIAEFSERHLPHAARRWIVGSIIVGCIQIILLSLGNRLRKESSTGNTQEPYVR